MKKYLHILLIAATTTTANAQIPTQRPAADFSKTQEAFYKNWEGKKPEKGQGYSTFKRFEWFWEQRMPAGPLQAPISTVWHEWERYNSQYASRGGLRGSNDSGNWVALGPSTSPGGYEGIGRINNIVFHPTDSNTFWVCTPAGGLWKTTDFGKNWVNTTDNAVPVLGCSDMVVDYSNTQVMYLATGDRDGGSLWTLQGQSAADTWSVGVLKSSDGGKTWRKTGLTYTIGFSFEIVNRLLMHPTNPKILWAACTDGIYRSIDSGANWSKRANGDFVDMELKPNNPNVLYAGMQNSGGGANLYRSTDGGLTWTAMTNISSSRRMNIEVCKASPNLVDVAVAATNRGLHGLYYSSDSGTTFTKYWDGTQSGKNMLHNSASGTGTGGQGEYDLAYAIDPKNENNIVIGGVNAWKSTNGGNSFSLMSYWNTSGGGGVPIVHADKHWMRFHPLCKNTSGVLFEANDGGIYYSRNLGNSWTHISNGLQIGQIYRMANAVTDASLTLMGHQDNGTRLRTGTNFSFAKGGDGMDCMIDHTNSSYMYATSQYGNLSRSNDKFSSNSTNITPGSAGTGAWVTPLAMDPKISQTIWAGYDDLFRSTNRGSSWTNMGGPLTSGTYRHIYISPAVSSVMLAGDLSNLWRSINGGTTWTKVNSGLNLSAGKITFACMSPTDTATYWVTLSGYTSGVKVYKTTNGGKTYTNISGNLPNVPANCITYEPGSSNGIYVGTDLGVYYRNDNLTNWVYFSRKLPNVPITELEVHVATKKIRAATFGRGIWESNLYTAQPQAGPNATFIATDSSICQGQSITFKSTTNNDPTSLAWSFQGGSPTTGTDTQVTVQYLTPGTYSVRLIATNLGGIDTLLRTAWVTVYANPALPLIKETDTNHLSSTAAYGNQWIFNGNPISGANDTFFKPTQSGPYRVERTDSNGCKSISGTYNFKYFNIGLPNLASNLNLTLYPNPGTGLFQCQFSQSLSGSCQLVVFNAEGKRVLTQQVHIVAGRTETIDLGKAPAGVYLVHIRRGGHLEGSGKIVVQR